MVTEEILFHKEGLLGVVTLNRPRALNALTHDMIRAFDRQLVSWRSDPEVRAVLVHSSSERAFCSGGDVVAIWRARQQLAEGETPSSAFLGAIFADEYQLDRRIHRFPKPYIALIDGITMGGGAGISVHGSHRIASERTRFAMPEVTLGLFPDVGASWFLSRCPGQIGTWLALTAARLEAADLLYAGLATCYVPSAKLAAFTADLCGTEWPSCRNPDGIHADSFGVIGAAIARHAESPPAPPPLAGQHEAIDRCFGFDRVEDIVAALRAESSPWAEEQLAALDRASPTSLKIALRALREAGGAKLKPCLIREYRLSQACISGHDYYEGVRARMIDKDQTPRWSPPTLEAVTPELVERHFQVPPGGDLVLSE